MSNIPTAPKFKDLVKPGQVWEGMQTGTKRTVVEVDESDVVHFTIGRDPKVMQYRGSWMVENRLIENVPEIPTISKKRERLDVMLDIESLSTAHNGATIQIAAVPFRIESGETYRNTFNRKISPKSCIEAGLDVNADTMKWWFGQDEHVQSEVLGQAIMYGGHLVDELNKLSGFLNDLTEQADKVFIWGYPATSDMTWLQQAYLAAKLPYPVAYNRTRCLGTIADLYWEAAGLKLSEQVKTKINHDALVDCQSQIEMVCKAYKELGYLNQKEVTK